MHATNHHKQPYYTRTTKKRVDPMRLRLEEKAQQNLKKIGCWLLIHRVTGRDQIIGRSSYQIIEDETNLIRSLGPSVGAAQTSLTEIFNFIEKTS